MPISLSLHIGLNSVNPDNYDNWTGRLQFAETDALDMFKLAQGAGFEQSLSLLGERATRSAIIETLKFYSRMAEPGSLVLITFSGHGGQLPNISEEGTQDKLDDEMEGLDETWCCYDRQLRDDEINYYLSLFPGGTRIVVLVDSCHSGTSVKNNENQQLDEFGAPVGSKILPPKKAVDIYKQQQVFYDAIAAQTPKVSLGEKPAILQISACQDEEYSFEGFGNGKFTKALLNVWADGKFQGTYKDLFTALEKQLTQLDNRQHPNYFRDGAVDDEFDLLPPFVPIKTAMKASMRLPLDSSGIPEFNYSKTGELLVEFESAPKVALVSTVATITDSYFVPGGQSVAIYRANTPKGEMQNDWDLAHALYKDLKDKGQSVNSIEPNQPHLNLINLMEELAKSTEELNPPDDIWIENWPHPAELNGNFDWHLKKSELADARDAIIALDNFVLDPIRIAHIDTGHSLKGTFSPNRLIKEKCKSFIPGEENNPGYDLYFGAWEQPVQMQGHGPSTLSLLAGPYLKKGQAPGDFEGYAGAIPFAEVYSLRIADAVILLKTRAFEKAIYHAVDVLKCEVITMSMGGAASHRWADAINYAYERGVTVVTAASNSFEDGILGSIAPKCVVYPARFERVICAVGISYNKQPYVFEANDWPTTGKEKMQGSWGPPSAMKYSIAAYTPNVPWINAPKDKKTGEITESYEMKGAGTSSATPQVAAAAGLWILKYRDQLKNYRGTWRQVEAVREALFCSADRLNHKFDTYLGKGALRAMNALNTPPKEENHLTMKPKAKVRFPVFTLLFGGNEEPGPKPLQDTPLSPFQKLDEPQQEMLVLEIIQLSYQEPGLHPLAELDWEDTVAASNWIRAHWEEVRATVQASSLASNFLKQMIS